MKLLVLCWSLSHWRSGPLRKALREYGSCLIFSLGPGSALAWAKKYIYRRVWGWERATAGLASLADIFGI